MVAQVIEPNAGWDVANKITMSGETQGYLSNTGSKTLRWTTTMSDVLPSLAIARAHQISAGADGKPMTMNDGERLWLVGDGAFGTWET